MVAYDNYRDQIEKKHNFFSQGKSAGNENRRWHGTRRECTIGNPENKTAVFCTSALCSTCSIFRTSFNLIQFGKHTNFGRFGSAIYTSATSSKSNDYIREAIAGSYRSFILAKVVLGHAKILTSDDSSLKSAPKGYDSVLGQPGHSLNYDEAYVLSYGLFSFAHFPCQDGLQ